MDISGFWPVLFAGLLGAALHEGLRIGAAWRSGTRPSAPELVWSGILAVLGALTPLLYGTAERPFLEIAQLAVGVPALISGGFAVANATRRMALTEGTTRSVPQYVGWRL